jgi:hypothetical protein
LFLWRKAAFDKTDIIQGKKKRNREEDDGDTGRDDGDGGNRDAGDGDEEEAEQDSIILDPVANVILGGRYWTMWP